MKIRKLKLKEISIKDLKEGDLYLEYDWRECDAYIKKVCSSKLEYKETITFFASYSRYSLNFYIESGGNITIGDTHYCVSWNYNQGYKQDHKVWLLTLPEEDGLTIKYEIEEIKGE